MLFITTATTGVVPGLHHCKSLMFSTASLAIVAAIGFPQSAHAESCMGQVCRYDEVFEANQANTISTGNWWMKENSTLNVTSADAITGDSYLSVSDNAVVNVTAANGISGGIQLFGGTPTLNVNVTDGISGGQLALRGDAVGNFRATRAGSGQDIQLTRQSVLNVLAEDAISAHTKIQFVAQSSVGGYLRLNGYSTVVGGIASYDGGAGVIENTGATTSMLSVDNSALTSEFSGIIRDGGPGALGLTLLNGQLRLSGANNYTGGTVINAGTLSISSDANLGAAAGGLTFNGGRLATNARFSSARAVLLNANGTFDVAAGTTLGLTGAISGTGGLVKTGTGTLTLSGVNSYTGGTTINDGTLTAGASGAFVNNTAYTINGGTLAFNNFNLTMSSLSGTGGMVAMGLASLNLNQATDTTYAGSLTGTGLIIKTGAGALTLAGDSSNFAGTTVVAGGTVRVDGTLGHNLAARWGGIVTGSGAITGNADLTNGGVFNGISGRPSTSVAVS